MDGLLNGLGEVVETGRNPKILGFLSQRLYTLIKTGFLSQRLYTLIKTGFLSQRLYTLIKTGFQHADFSASADFFACADFSAYPDRNFHHNVDC